MTTYRPARPLKFVVALGAAGILAAACGSGSSGGNGASSVSVGHGGSGQAASSHRSGAVVEVQSGSLGSHLTDAAGKTLYRFAADTGSQSTCSGTCAMYWPPLLTKGKPTAGSGATASQLGTTKRSDGTTQVTYAGHPLYYYSGDNAAGDTNGQGLNLSGGLWWAVAPSGANITSGGSSSGGGYGGY